MAREKTKTSYRQSLKSSGKVLTREIPRDEEAAPLWTRMAIVMFTTLPKSEVRPKAKPSKIECTERAIMRMNGVMLGQQLDLFFSSLIECARSCAVGESLWACSKDPDDKKTIN